jgi:hypothetical protein
VGFDQQEYEENMLITYELRWFYPGTIPEDILLWFERDCLTKAVQPLEEREDLYLYLPECDYLGVKLRQGRLEVKWRKAEFGATSFGEFVEGKVEKWGKWLCCDSTEESFQRNQTVEKGAWVNIQKVRYSQLFQVIPGLSPQPIAGNEEGENGCQVELTELTFGDNHWWSLAFEAFGEDSNLMDNLERTGDRIFKSYKGPKLLVTNSYGYPRLLAIANK